MFVFEAIAVMAFSSFVIWPEDKMTWNSRLFSSLIDIRATLIANAAIDSADVSLESLLECDASSSE